jgi:hypothetical protein
MKNNQEVIETATPIQKKLKPVTFIGSDYSYFRNGEFQQNLLLKAMQVTTDPNELRKMIGVKTVADVYRTLDKLSIRKEYHEALFSHGLTLDYIVNGIKGIIENPMTSSAVKLKSLQSLLKSVGLDKYEKQEDVGKSWEELLLQHNDNKPKELNSGNKKINYEVKEPPIPESERVKREKEKGLAEGLYGRK